MTRKEPRRAATARGGGGGKISRRENLTFAIIPSGIDKGGGEEIGFQGAGIREGGIIKTRESY